MIKAFLKYLLLLGLSALLSATTVILGAFPMRALRTSFGLWPFWIGLMAVAVAFVAAGLPSFALMVFALMITVGVFTEIEKHGASVFSSGLVSILVAMGSSAIAMGIWFFKTRTQLLTYLRAESEPLVARLSEMNANSNITVDAIIQQMPSGLVIAVMAALAIALIGDGKLQSWLQLPMRASESMSEKLNSFRAPDLFVWLAMVAILGAFLQHGIKWLEVVSVNVINILVVTYFFQGLAIAASAFRAFKIGPFWQGLWYIVLIIQLFFLVALVGFADFWLEFRERLSRKEAEVNKGI